MISQYLRGQSNQDTLIYVGDPMCSWCYGFSPEVDKLLVMNPDLKLKLIMGGLRYNGTETMAELGAFLKEHWEEVAHRTGRKFAYEILKKSDFVYNTGPACRAVVAAGMTDVSKVWAYFKALQEAFYSENQDPTQKSTFISAAKKAGLSEVIFSQNLEGMDSQNKLIAELDWAQKSGIRSFPTILYKSGDKWFVLAQGYATADTMHKKLRELKILEKR